MAFAIVASVAVLSCGASSRVATTLQPELVITGATLIEMIRAIVDEADRHDLPVFAHIRSLDELKAVLEGGAAGTVHTVWDDRLPDAALAEQIRAAGYTIVPTLALYAGGLRTPSAHHPQHSLSGSGDQRRPRN